MSSPSFLPTPARLLGVVEDALRAARPKTPTLRWQLLAFWLLILPLVPRWPAVMWLDDRFGLGVGQSSSQPQVQVALSILVAPAFARLRDHVS